MERKKIKGNREMKGTKKDQINKAKTCTPIVLT
jgi:hypothetical protein